MLILVQYSTSMAKMYGRETGSAERYLEVTELLPRPLGEEAGVRRHCELVLCSCCF
jgi:hypothetical protein